MSTGLYFYAICRGLPAERLEGETGIGDAPLRMVENDDLAAVVSEVDLEEFDEEGLRRNLENLAWLEQVALAHDRVTRTVAEQAPTAPLRLATVFRSEDSLREQMTQWQASARRALDRIEGRSEWSVKAYADPHAPSDEAAAADSGAAEGMGAGKAYLLKRRAATQQREATLQEDADTAARMHDDLTAAAVAGRRLAPQDRKLSGHTGEMILNGTYLVQNDSAAAFRETVARVGGTSSRIRVELGGPWPPYSFASLDEQ